MKAILRFVLLASCLVLVGCWNPFRNPFSFGGGGDSSPSANPNRILEATEKFALAIGGVRAGRDELVIYGTDGNARDFGNQTLECSPDNPILQVHPRPDYNTAAAGSGVQMVAVEPGVTAIRCKLDGTDMGNVYEITIPPQNLIQILVAEAGNQLAKEAQLDDTKSEKVVKLTSVSLTGNAVGSVIKNRINKINIGDDPALFNAVASDYKKDPPVSYYDAVILATNQFSPANPSNVSHRTFDNAQDRNFLDGDWLVAYDQAVLTAAGIFNGDITDTTGGSFAFRSPTAEEWALISTAWSSGVTEIPGGTGFTDEDFPNLAPIQILIQPDVATYTGGRPAFVFARSRTAADKAVVNTP